MSRGLDRLGVLQLAGGGLLLAICLASTLHAVFFSEAVPFVRRAGGPPWIGAALPATSNLIGVDPAAPPAFDFVRRFGVEDTTQPARLVGRALRDVEIELNGQTLLPRDTSRSWRRRFEVDVSRALREGRNELRARVRNAHGPPLLQLELRLGSRSIESDASWQVAGPRGNPAPAVIARDVTAHPESQRMAGPAEIALERALPLALLFAASALGALALSRRLPASLRARAPQATLALVVLLWLLLFVTKLAHMPLLLGFDAPAHLLYVDFILERHTLPLASDGFSSYHPPLFYLLTSLLVGLSGVSQAGLAGQAVYRLIPFACGLANVGLTFLVARRLWPGDALRGSLAVACAGLLPLNLYMSAYVSNEPLQAALISLALWIASGLLLAPTPGLRPMLGLAACLGLALLTKFTSLLLAPLIAGPVALRDWLLEREPAAGALVRLAAIAGVAVCVCGWFYLRNLLVFGDALVWNLDVPGAATWWMQPGFHTAAYYTGFGEVLRNPFFAGYASFWDGVYSTLWGDGLVAGMISPTTRHGFWRYDYMAVGYWLALPASVGIAVGFLRLLRQALRHPDARRRIVLSLIALVPFLLGFSLFRISLSLPFYAQAKASYALAAVLPLSLVAAEGLALLPERLPGSRFAALRALYFGWLGTLGGVIAAAFLG